MIATVNITIEVLRITPKKVETIKVDLNDIPGASLDMVPPGELN